MGGEMDRLVAEKMGWEISNNRKYWIKDFDGSTGTVVEHFNPSEDIKDAWVVVEYMREKGFHYEMSNCPHKGIMGNRCRFWDYNEFDEFIEAIGIDEIAPLAICKAFLEVE